ncbi:hypothetical protein DVS28_b0007 (plasmid) [Euzebya pacifica]|uniref:Uncharacterized protein n=1 Tax=Euzebya pacifica TaxID=1608957 RepID=A0A346Y5N0_9ACTN|nr:hypothetical protein [Euzebya pacifica]AXV09777.1 hypothetical protein DVS28_b0007 [Euzebya pacifica]
MTTLLHLLAQTPTPTGTPTAAGDGPAWWVELLAGALVAFVAGWAGGWLAFRRAQGAARADRTRERNEAHHVALGLLIDTLLGIEAALRHGGDANDLVASILHGATAAHRPDAEAQPVHDRLVAYLATDRTNEDTRDSLLGQLQVWRSALHRDQAAVAIRREGPVT